MKQIVGRLLIVMLPLCSVQPASAGYTPLVEIGTVGPTESTERWVRLWQQRTAADRPANSFQPPKIDPKKAFAGYADTIDRITTFRTDKLPVRTPNMTPGREPARSFDIPALPNPVCLVGTDPFSLQWVAHHRQQLLDLNAMCIVVEAPNETALSALINVLGDVPWFAASGVDIAKAHRLSHYPVLISKQYIEH